jgi:hypothetical protein
VFTSIALPVLCTQKIPVVKAFLAVFQTFCGTNFVIQEPQNNQWPQITSLVPTNPYNIGTFSFYFWPQIVDSADECGHKTNTLTTKSLFFGISGYKKWPQIFCQHHSA